MIHEAILLASQAHAGQFRKYTVPPVPYILHPLRVSLMVAEHKLGPVSMAAAVLHDTLEDTDLQPEVIQLTCGSEVLARVQALTNPSHTPEHRHKSRAERKQIDRDHLAECTNAVRIIKLCDRLDNLLEMDAAPADFKRLYAQESRLLLDVLQAGYLELGIKITRRCNELEKANG